MTKWLATAAFGAALMFGSAIGAAHAATAQSQKVQSSTVTDISAHQQDRRHYHRYAYRPYYPYYYGRPYYYSPGPFFPLPPFFGYGWDLW
jgi:hypothetical protein